MKYTVYYNVPKRLDFHAEFTDVEHLESQALFRAKNASGADVELVQILPEGEKSQLLRDQPPDNSHPLPPPPMPPLGMGGDMMLQRVA